MKILYDYLLYFMIYAFLGWCAEVAFAAVKHGKFVNRGMLRGAYCPIYGFGVLLVNALLSPLSSNVISGEGGDDGNFWINLLILFICSAIITSLLELLTGFVLDKLFHRKWWDYSDMKFNIGGYICPIFSLLWGAACVIIVDIVHPFIAFLCGLIPTGIGIAVIVVFYLLFIADVLLTVPEIYALRSDIRLISQLESGLYAVSDKIGKDIYDKTVEQETKLENLRTNAKTQSEKNRAAIEKRFEKIRSYLEENLSEKLPDLNAATQHKDRIKEQLSKRYTRLFKAFPGLQKPGKPENVNSNFTGSSQNFTPESKN